MSKERQAQLSHCKGVQDLFDHLQNVNEKHQEDSRFRRGVEKVGPTLNGISQFTALGAPLAALDPIANTAFGIFQPLLTIALEIGGVEEAFRGHVEEMVGRVPVVERCNGLLTAAQSLNQQLSNILVLVYKDLLDFYFEALKVLENDNYFLTLQKDQFTGEIASIVSAFTSDLESLSMLLGMETFAGVQKIESTQEDERIRTLLSEASQSKMMDFYDSLSRRTDAACSWITLAKGFNGWRDTSGFCIILGDMGSGKSVTTSFFAEFLKANCSSVDSGVSLVCTYYCKDDNETNKARGVYRSILYQILTRIRSLRAKFWSWYNQEQEKGTPCDPTFDTKAMRAFLIAALQNLPLQVYLILDAMDEYHDHERDELLSFLESFPGKRAPLKVFLSSRQDRSIRECVEERLFQRRILQMPASRDRD